jgi:hypothetical protein
MYRTNISSLVWMSLGAGWVFEAISPKNYGYGYAIRET